LVGWGLGFRMDRAALRAAQVQSLEGVGLTMISWFRVQGFGGSEVGASGFGFGKDRAALQVARHGKDLELDPAVPLL